MKKITSILLGLLCAVCASAGPIRVTGTVNYGASYRGAGRGVYATSSARYHSAGSNSMAQAPVATMTSTSTSYGRGIAQNTAPVSTPQVACISTTASNIRGGVTTAQAYTPNGRLKRSAWPGGNPEGCDCDWQWDPSLFGGEGGYYCTKCGETISEEDYLNLKPGESPHGSDPCPCHMPIADGKDVWMLMSAIAGAYALYKQKIKKVE